jgi:predicted enzyme related to lactoylglutathione lyase
MERECSAVSASSAALAKAAAIAYRSCMDHPALTLAFFKLNVAEMEPALEFWREAFGFAVAMTFDEPEFLEHIMSLPDLEGGPSLLLVAYKDGRDVSVGPGHGPVGFQCTDIDASYKRALASGAQPLTGILSLGPVRVAMLRSPQGHEIELVQLPG